jgi:hypothetical protein
MKIEKSKFFNFDFSNLIIHNLEISNGSDVVKYNGQVYLFPMFMAYGHSLMDVYAQYKILKLKYPELKPVCFEDSSRGWMAESNNISKDLMDVLGEVEIIDISKNSYIFEEIVAFFDLSKTLPIDHYVPFCDCYMGTEKCGTSEWFKYNYLAIDTIREDFKKYMQSTRFRKIFISREKYNQKYLQTIEDYQSKTRYYKDEKQLEDFLKSKGYEIVYAEDYGLKDQIKLFSEAEVIASVSGAGLFNLIWADKTTKILEIMVNPLYRYHFKEFANHVGVDYIQIDCKEKSFEYLIEQLKEKA